VLLDAVAIEARGAQLPLKAVDLRQKCNATICEPWSIAWAGEAVFPQVRFVPLPREAFSAGRFIVSHSRLASRLPTVRRPSNSGNFEGLLHNREVRCIQDLAGSCGIGIDDAWTLSPLMSV